ncbi:MAG: hypothetical protein OEV49_15275 [candidate division Zixibacteria bacterium]|nr:hypothetical protein [candidate division Zixibacteria bacterium]MDH3936459.1 hypothetical protein [candidate division Zixibacteria bacterium]MDH4033104.1 hypothetical protein [candidate division Zixibacteria bacterium]
MLRKRRIPLISVPGLSLLGQNCIWQLHKVVRGKRSIRLGRSYKCPRGITQKGNCEFKVGLVSAPKGCDQDPGLIPGGSVLTAEGTIVRRSDGLAQFVGRFKILDPGGRAIFSGHIVTFDRIGSHQKPFGSESCKQPKHVEGWIDGKGLYKLRDWTIRADLVAEGSLSLKRRSTLLWGFLNGVLTR